jgi:tRNA(Arg) A34 adenosine deaminase TadA
MTAGFFHESIERQPAWLESNDEYINQIMSVDYYDNLSHICSHMFEKYGPSGRPETYHICAFFNLKDNKIIMGENSMRKHPRCPISTHAEMDVLRKVFKQTQTLSNSSSRRIDRYDVLVIRVSKTGKLGASRPCYHCINSMQNNPFVKIRNVYYSVNNGQIVRERLEDMLNSSLTTISTGWRVRTNKTRYGEPKISGYSSDDSNDSKDSKDSRDSKKSKNSYSPPSKYYSRSNSPVAEKIFPYFDKETGRRCILPESMFNKINKNKS